MKVHGHCLRYQVANDNTCANNDSTSQNKKHAICINNDSSLHSAFHGRTCHGALVQEHLSRIDKSSSWDCPERLKKFDSVCRRIGSVVRAKAWVRQPSSFQVVKHQFTVNQINHTSIGLTKNTSTNALRSPPVYFLPLLPREIITGSWTMHLHWTTVYDVFVNHL